LTSFIPMDGLPRPVSIVPEGYQFPVGIESAKTSTAMVDKGYFDTMRLSIIAGRGIRQTDTAETPQVAVVNDQFAQHYWGGQNPLGKRFRVTDGSGPWVEIVGVVKTTKYTALTEQPTDFIFFPYQQRLQRVMVLLAESQGDPADLAAPLREVVRRLDPDQPANNVRTMDDHYRMRVVAIFNVIVTSVAAMGLMGLGLAMVGLYGLVAYAASRRTREIGIRMAIGAGCIDIVRMVLRQGMACAVAGLAVGLLASVAVDRLLAATLPGGAAGTGRTDVVPFLLVAGTVLAVTLLAAYLPARRASQINPTEALRYD
jgi:predicted permease